MNVQPTNEQVLMQAAQGFLQRAELKGREVDTYAKCFNIIQTIVEGENVVVPATAFLAGLKAVKKLADLKKKEEDEGTTIDGCAMVSEGGPPPPVPVDTPC